LSTNKPTEAAHGRDGVFVGPHNELQNDFVDLESLSEDASDVLYWLSKEPQYKQFARLAVDLVATPVKRTLNR